MRGISFNAIINRITTTIDGGWRISLDVPQSEIEAIMKLSSLRDESLQIVALNPVMLADYNMNGDRHS